MTALIVVLVVVLVVTTWAGLAYNKLVSLRNEAEAGYSQIEVTLKRRADLVPNLVEVVKGYAAHESSTFEAVTKARQATMGAGTPAELMAADQLMGQALGQLMALRESYPELKASQNFLELQSQLDETEGRIAGARNMYNVTVRRYNTRCQSLPSNLIANMFHFQLREFFQVEDAADRAPQQVSFT